jgi:hypothetical protein
MLSVTLPLVNTENKALFLTVWISGSKTCCKKIIFFKINIWICILHKLLHAVLYELLHLNFVLALHVECQSRSDLGWRAKIRALKFHIKQINSLSLWLIFQVTKETKKTFLSVENVCLPVTQNLWDLTSIDRFKWPCGLRLRSAATNPAEHMVIRLVCLLCR